MHRDWSSVQPMPLLFATPRLSTICCLDGIIPLNGNGNTDWSVDAKTAFVNMTSTRPMKMTVRFLSMIFFINYCCVQGSHASWKVLESFRIFTGKFPGPGKSWKSTCKVLESPGIC